MPESEASQNPVTVARHQVEAVIPPEKRGPGWDRHWRTEAYFSDHPFLTAAAAEWLVANGGLGLVMLVLGLFVLIGAAVWAFVLVGRARREQRSASDSNQP